MSTPDWTPGGGLSAPTRLSADEIEARLRSALQRSAIEVHLQPVVALPSARPIGVEALARWLDPVLGHVPPDVFIPVAERTGLIHELGRQVLSMACRAAATWPVRDRGFPQVAVNVSPLQLAEPALLAHVTDALTGAGLDPSQLVLEITESSAIGDFATSAAQLHALRALGARIALDDFGIGHSPLSLLRQFPLDILKIDRSFVARVHENARDAIIVRLLVDTAHTLGLTVCGEGVESPEQARQLVALGCDSAQGWHFGRPAPASGDLARHLGRQPPIERAVDLAVPEPIQIGSDEVITISDPHAQLVYASPGALGVLGYTPSELIGTNVAEHLHPDERAQILGAPRDAASQTAVILVHRARHSDGTFRWLRTRVQLLRNARGAPSQIVATSRDITKEVETERQLASIEATLGWAFDQSPIGMALSSFDGAIIRTNQAFSQMLGYQPHELVGALVPDLTHPDDLVRDASNLRELLSDNAIQDRPIQDRAVQHVTKRYLHRDGSPVPARVWATTLADEHDQPTVVVAHIMPADVSP